MQLPFVTNKKDEGSAVYLGLLLKEDQGTVLAMQKSGASFRLLDREYFRYSNGWENLTEDVDEVLFTLEKRAKVHFKKTIVYLYSHLIDEKTGEIKKEYFKKVQGVSKNLELAPLGYIECYEAVARRKEEQEELPLTSILVELDKTHISVFIYKGGRKVFQKLVARTDSLIDDFSSSVQELKGTMLLPARIILYNSSDLDDMAAEILTHRWSEDLFIQLPRVEILKEHDMLEGLISVFQKQLADTKEKEEVHASSAPHEVLGFKIGEDSVEQQEQHEEKMFDFFQRVRLPRFTFSTSRIPLAIGIGLVLVGIILNEYFFHKAQLTVYLSSYRAQKSVTIEGAKVSVATFSADLTDSRTTTGKKEVGEKAKGEVTVHNFSSSSRAIPAGTRIEYGGQSFILNQDVSVASASNTLVSGGLVKQPGKAKVGVTASEIGAQSNLDKGKQFTIEGLPQDLYIAINESAFSGGTKREVRTVAKKDTDDLVRLILEKAQQENEKNASFQEKKARGLLKDLTEREIVKSELSHEVGEESNEITFKATVETTAYLYDKDAVASYLLRELADSVPKGFTLSKERIAYTFDDVTKEDDIVTLLVKATGIAMKKVAEEEVKNKVRFRPEKDIEKILASSYEVKGYKIANTQPLPLPIKLLPIFKKNIMITFSVL